MIGTICCLGGNNFGTLTSCVIAHKCPEIRVTVVDNKKVIAKWNTENPPFSDPELIEILKKCQNRNLFFSCDYSQSIKDTDLVFITVNIPLKAKGLGKGKVLNLKRVEEAARMIALHGDNSKIVVAKSNVPGFLVDVISLILGVLHQPGVEYQVMYNPDFIPLEDVAMKDLLSPKRIVIGCSSHPQGKAAANLLRKVYEIWAPKENISISSLPSAEVTKLSSEVFLAQKYFSFHTFLEICDKTNSNYYEVANILSTDSRLGTKYIEPIVEFRFLRGRVCSLVNECENLKLPEAAEYWRALLELIDYEKERFLQQVEKYLQTVPRHTVGIWGFVHETNSNEISFSPAEDICERLLSDGVSLQIYDPIVEADKIVKRLRGKGDPESLKCCPDPYSAVTDADAVIVCSAWNEFTKLDYSKVYSKMKHPLMIDTRKFLNPEIFKRYGFQFHTIRLEELF